LAKIREDLRLPQEVKGMITHTLEVETKKATQNDYPPRTRTGIAEMLLRKGYRTWQQEQAPKQAGEHT
jgi:hypothetical protein